MSVCILFYAFLFTKVGKKDIPRIRKQLVRIVNRYAPRRSRIRIKNVADEDESANAKSIVLLLSMSLTKGTEVEISASGPDEQEAVDALIALIESGFGETD